MGNFNYDRYSRSIQSWIPDVSEDDARYLANKAADLYKSVEEDGCVDNFRITEVKNGVDVNPAYQEAVDSGCCGSRDELYTNPLTHRTFKIGFNFGH